MRIAIITAMAEETLPILKKLGNIVDESTIAGVYVRKIQLQNDTVYLATSGIGEIKAAMTVQLLADLFDVEIVLNFGFVGALNENLNVGDIVIPNKVCHYQFDISKINGTKIGQYGDKDDIYMRLDTSLIDLVKASTKKDFKEVAVASGDKFVSTLEDKHALVKGFGCDICEMELAGLQIACERNSIPILSIKVVSDKADNGATESFNEILNKGLTKYEEILPNVLKAITGGYQPLPPINKR